MIYSKEFEEWFNKKYPSEALELLGVAEAIKDIAYAAWQASEKLVNDLWHKAQCDHEHSLHYDAW